MKKRIVKSRFKRFMASVMSAVLMMSTVLVALPDMTIGSYADEIADKTITGLGTGAIKIPTPGDTEGLTGWTGSYVYYGTFDSDSDPSTQVVPVRYRVLAADTTDFSADVEEGQEKVHTMLLDCDSLLKYKRFDNDGSPNDGATNANEWAYSDIKTYLNGDFMSNYSASEQAAIAVSSKASPSSSDGKGWVSGSTDYLPWTALNNSEKIFLLDAKEATNTSYGYEDKDTSSNTRKKNMIGTTDADWWWLRSPHCFDTSDAGNVDTSGDISSFIVKNGRTAVSPAFNINLSSVIFTSVISGTAGSAGAEYKLTVADSNLGIAVTDGSNVTRSGNTITVPYTITGTNAGNATQVSVLITDSAYSAGTAATSGYTYQKLSVDTWSESGTGTFTLPDAYADKTCGTDYYAYILAEDVNGTYETDYASVPAAITITNTAEVTTVPVAASGWTYDGAEHGLIATAGIASNGTVKYAVRTDNTAPADSEYTYTDASAIKGKNTGTYKIWYKAF